MAEVDTRTTLEKFRRFIIYNTCASFIPEGYLKDPSIFPERDSASGPIYVEAASKIELERIRDMKFVKVADVLGIIYTSKSGNTSLKWRQLRGTLGRLTGRASPNSVVNLLQAGILTRGHILRMLHTSAEERPSESSERDTSGQPEAP